MCMMMRGVEKQNSKIQSSTLRGCFFDPAIRRCLFYARDEVRINMNGNFSIRLRPSDYLWMITWPGSERWCPSRAKGMGDIRTIPGSRIPDPMMTRLFLRKDLIAQTGARRDRRDRGWDRRGSSADLSDGVPLMRLEAEPSPRDRSLAADALGAARVG